MIHTSSTAQVATTVEAMVDSTIGKASHTPAIEQKNATMSCTSVSATMITARTAAVRTGSGSRGLAYMLFTPPSQPLDLRTDP
ncbi:hypothetical protein ACH4LN_31195 [Streptomyces albus]|uniref:hypothetical protein n=1 Tax=Streptomyces TaxID=1883 RepID=UPI0004BD68A3|nr:hypothetical protein [Streptomyces albus]KPC86911.1 hypothetical protein ADL27_44925 [Streptomyces sp. NRRL F-6602]MDI6411157.1 hypothetical protein [Streptomyces albus]BDY34048.1 hypothetical protein [Streptomyces albus]GHJ20621.1 hypothetical protein TPA0909_22350 [Streptomyces albus]